MFGSRLYASDGSLIASENTYNPVYVGDATPLSYEVGARVALTDYYLKRIWTMRIACVNRPIPFLVPVAGEILAILQIVEVASGQWNIVVAQGEEYSAPRVLCFASKPLGTPSGYGYAIYDAAGNTCFDSGKNHLIVDAIGQSPPMPMACSPNKNGQSYYTSFPQGSSSCLLTNPVANPAFFCGSVTAAGCSYSASGINFYGLSMRAFVVQGGNTVKSVWGAATAASSGATGVFNNNTITVAVTNAARY